MKKLKLLVLLVPILLTVGCATNQPVKTEPVGPEPVKPEPVKPEPVKPEPVKPEPVKPEPIKPEPIKPEPIKPEPIKPEPIKPEPIKPEPIKPGPIKPEPIKPEPIKPEPIKPEPVKPEPVKPEPVKPEPVKPEPVKPEPVKPEPVKPEPEIENQSYTINGQITLDQTKLSRKNAEVNNTVVYFVPDDKTKVKLKPTNANISTLNKRFEPNVLAITVGSQVSFPNMDRILHNVFSVSPKSEFDLGLYSAGTTKTVTFENPGIIYVHCNVHHSMQADILVLDTPFFTTVDNQGKFSLSGINDLVGTLKIWHPRSGIKEIPLSANQSINNLSEVVKITRPKVPKHTNKFGKSYRPTRD